MGSSLRYRLTDRRNLAALALSVVALLLTRSCLADRKARAMEADGRDSTAVHAKGASDAAAAKTASGSSTGTTPADGASSTSATAKSATASKTAASTTAKPSASPTTASRTTAARSSATTSPTSASTSKPTTTRTASTSRERVFDDEEIDTPVRLARNNPPPEYPPALLAERLEGMVTLRFVVDTTGRAEMRTVKVLDSTHPAFTKAALAVLPQYRFTPAQAQRTKVRSMVELPMRFKTKK